MLHDKKKNANEHIHIWLQFVNMNQGLEAGGTGGCGATLLVEEVDRVDDCAVAGHRRTAVLRFLDECFQDLEGASNLLLGNVCHLEDLTEASLLVVLSTGYKDASGNDGVLRLALEQLCVVRHLVEHLCRLSRRSANVLAVAERCDLPIGRLERLVDLVVVALVVRPREITHSHATVAEADFRLELGAVQQRVGGISDTRRIIVTLV